MKDVGKGSEVDSESHATFGAGAVRYRVWPARRHPLRLAIVGALAIAAAVAASIVWENGWWAAIAGLAILGGASPFFFPTEIALDGSRLIMRQLGMPREYDLRSFTRVEVVGEMVLRAELSAGSVGSPLDAVQAIAVPLPKDAKAREGVLLHLHRWVGRRTTGQFAFDDDHAPDDEIHG